MAAVAPHHYTPEEYLAIERGAPFKSEYRDGRIFALCRHDALSANFHDRLIRSLPSEAPRAYPSGIRVQITRENWFVYPDVAASSEEASCDGGTMPTLLNPSLVVEVFSESTEAYDRGDKFAAYRQIDALQEYVLVAQHRVLVERYRRSGDIWAVTWFESLDDVLELESVGASLPLAEIYKGTDFG